MFSKIIFVLVTVCVVNASVLTVQVYDDDPETEVASNPKDCNLRACDQLCRRLKFPGGTCVNGRCKCDNFLNAEDGVSEKSLYNLENSVSQEDVLEAEVSANSRRCNVKVCELVCRWFNKTNGSCVDGHCKCANSTTTKGDLETRVENKKSNCNNQACHQLCRRLKFPGGACFNGRCKCDNFLNAEVFVESLSNPEDSISPRACYNQLCYNLCRKIKLRGGACIEGKCICNKNLSEQEDAKTDPAEFLSPASCDFRACDQQCFRYGYSGGTCVNGRCKCNRFLNTEDTMVDPAELLPLSSCNSIACDDQCRRNGWHSGVCIKGQCKCDHFLNTEVSENSLSNLEDSVSPRKCIHQECNAQCRKLMFREGVCIAGRCSCNNYFPPPKDTMNDMEEYISLDDNFLSTEDKIPDESLPVFELSEEQTARGCNMQACHQLCRRLKFPGGACFNGRCKCDNFFGTGVAADEYSEFAPRRACKLTKCNRKCTRRGYEGATCVNGRCKCYKNLQEKDASLLNDVTSDENEESTVVLRTNEEEPVVLSPSACNTVNCNQMCHRLKYAGGWCRFGQCQCY